MPKLIGKYDLMEGAVTQAGMYWIGFGDIHGSLENLAGIQGLSQAQGVIITGDLTNLGGVAQASQVISAVAEHNRKIYAQIGNMDQAVVQTWLDSQGLGIHTRAVELAPGLGLMGVGFSTITPFGTPSEVPDQQLGLWLHEALAQAQVFDRLVLAVHNPPHDTLTDRISSGAHVGSLAVRQFIEQAQPQLCLTGHIHESRGVDHLGQTTIINPGDLAHGGYVRLQWDGRNITGRLLNVFDQPLGKAGQ